MSYWQAETKQIPKLTRKKQKTLNERTLSFAKCCRQTAKNYAQKTGSNQE